MTLGQWCGKNERKTFKVYAYNTFTNSYMPISNSPTLYRNFDIEKIEVDNASAKPLYKIYIKRNSI